MLKGEKIINKKNENDFNQVVYEKDDESCDTAAIQVVNSMACCMIIVEAFVNEYGFSRYHAYTAFS